MRRVTLVIKNLNQIGAGSFFEKISEMEVIHYLRSDANGLVGIWRLVLKDSRASPKTLLQSDGATWWSRFSRMQVLPKGPEGFVAYVEIFPRSSELHRQSLDVHIVSMEVRGGRIKLAVLGETRQLRRLLQQMTADGMDYVVAEVSEPTFEPSSPLMAPTARQRKILLTAFQVGSYDIPRRIDSQKLAKSLGLDKSTVVENLRKSERRMIEHLLGKSNAELGQPRK